MGFPCGGGAEDEITPAEDPVTTNQVSRPGQFQIVDGNGQPLQLRRAELTPTGFSIAGPDWTVTGTGAFTAERTTVQPGDVISINGSGFQRLTTTGIYLLSKPTWVASGTVSYENEFRTTFRVPALPPGNHTLQINAMRQGRVATSIAIGLQIAPSGAPLTTPIPAQDVERGRLITFPQRSSRLTPAAKQALTALALGTDQGLQATITAFSGGATTRALAQRRARAIEQQLKARGFEGPIAIAVRPAPTAGQRSSALVRIGGADDATAEMISALIVRYAPSVTPTVGQPTPNAPAFAKDFIVAKYLGFRLYRVDLPAPVSSAEAERLAKRLTATPEVAFAEPDSIVTVQISLP